jgi:hypothetical protein
MRPSLLFANLLISGAALAASWSPQRAAEYLDGRQKEWFAWPRAASADGPCVSCHTGLTYLLARPALRRVLGEKHATQYETGLLNRLRAKAGAEPPGALQGVETVFAALFLASQDGDASSSRAAFNQLWTLQRNEALVHGAALWYSAGLDPWETPAASYYGSALAALALGSAPPDVRTAPEAQEHIRALQDFLRSDSKDRPLHSRLALLWASTKLPDLLAAPARRALIDEVVQKQQPDGGWTLESLGPWAAHPDAPASSGVNAYATAFTTYVLQQAGVAAPRALEWLQAHQDPQTGAWPAVSMNKQYPAGSMEEKFLQDAATAFAALALIEATSSGPVR